MRTITVGLLIGWQLVAQTAAKFPADRPPVIPPIQLRAMMKAACSGKVSQSAKGFLSCSACPNEGDGWGLGAVKLGHFVRPDKQNALIEMMGCGPGGANPMGPRATSVMIEKEGEVWTNPSYHPEGTDSDCHKLTRPDGLDLLFCVKSEMFHGEMHDFYSVFDYSRGEKADQLLHLTGTGAVGCFYPAYRDDSVVRFGFTDRNGDGLNDITVRVAHFYGTYSEEERDACSQHPSDPPKAGTTETFDLVFYFDGERFKASPATVAALKKME